MTENETKAAVEAAEETAAAEEAAATELKGIKKLDKKLNDKGGVVKTIWQIVKFLIVSAGVTIIQLILANVLPLIFDHVTSTLPAFLQTIFNPDAIFDVTTAAGAEDYAKYVVNGVVTWGYVWPFFLSNAIANAYGYYQNKKTTFKSDAPKINFVIYIVLLIALILFSTWLQGVIYGWLINFDNAAIAALARTIASLACGAVQAIVLFPMEKWVLLKEKKPAEDEAEEAPAED